MNRSSEEQEALLAELALATESWLRQCGCVRRGDNENPENRSIGEICETLDISKTMFRAVRFKAWELGIPLIFGYFKHGCTGYYIGKKGEEARMLSHAQAVLAGIGESVFDGLFALGQAGTLEDAELYSRQTLNRPLNQLPEMLKALGSPLPREAAKVLTDGK